MIILRLKGGLGNQLFQLVAAYNLGRKLHRRIYIDSTSLASYSENRAFDAADLLDLSDSVFYHCNGFQELLLNLISRFRLSRIFPFLGLQDKHLHQSFFLIPFTIKKYFPLLFIDSYMLSGWTEDTFYEAILQSPWRQSFDSSLSLSPVPKEVVIHVRGGDFLSLPTHNICLYDHYRRCVHLAIQSGYKFFAIVTDDDSYGLFFLRNLKHDFPNVHFRKCDFSGNPLNDFSLLRNSTALIAGNSTFAFWANALSPSIVASWSSPRFSLALNKPFKFNFETWSE